MKLLSNPRAKRQAAIVVLLAWLFALAAGFANACLLEVSKTGIRGVVTAASTAFPVPALLAGQAQAAPGHHDDSGTSRASCHKVSDDSSRLAPKAFFGIDHTSPGPATVTAVLWSAVSSTPRRIEHLAPRAFGLPIQIRFARLAQ